MINQIISIFLEKQPHFKMNLTLVLLFLGLSFVSGEYKFPDLNENERTGEEIISDKFEDFKSNSHDRYLLKPFFEDLLGILNNIQKKNNEFIKKMPGIVSHDIGDFESDTVENAQTQFHGLASVQYSSLMAVVYWAEQRLDTIKHLENIHSLLYNVQGYCETAAKNLENIAKQTFEGFDDVKKSLENGYYYDFVSYRKNIRDITKTANFAIKTQEAIDATNKLIQKCTPLTQKINNCLTCGSTKVE